MAIILMHILKMYGHYTNAYTKDVCTDMKRQLQNIFKILEIRFSDTTIGQQFMNIVVDQEVKTKEDLGFLFQQSRHCNRELHKIFLNNVTYQIVVYTQSWRHYICRRRVDTK